MRVGKDVGINNGKIAGVFCFTSNGVHNVSERAREVLRIDVNWINSLCNCGESGGKLEGIPDEWDDNVRRWWDDWVNRCD